MTHDSTNLLPVEISVKNNVATIVLSRPEQRNALDRECRALLMQALATIEEDDDIRATILTGTGKVFCAGQNLDEPLMDPGSGSESRIWQILEEEYSPLMLALHHCKKPLVCAVNGDAFGGGVNIALACDLVVAAQSSHFVLPYCRLGLTTDAGGSFFLPRMVGRARAFGMLLLGERVDAVTAQQWGLIWKAVQDDELSEFAEGIASQLAAGPSEALQAIKTGLNAAESHSLEEQLEHEKNAQRILEKTDNYREGRRAFFEKRAPKFR